MKRVAAPKEQPHQSVSIWPSRLGVGSILLVALGLVAAQFDYSKDPANQVALSNLSQRATTFRKMTDRAQRDSFCIPLSAYGRALDQVLPADARIFISDMLGPTNASKMGTYYILRNYLFPRPVEISLDGKAIFSNEGATGVPCNSEDELRKNGFDLLVISWPDGSINLTPLTPKGRAK